MLERLLAGFGSYLYRRKIVSEILDLGLRIYGDNGWKMMMDDGTYRGRLEYYTELPKLFNATAINLSLPTTPIKTGVSSRIFDILSSGGFVMAPYKSDIANLLKLDDEMICFHHIDDLREKIDYF